MALRFRARGGPGTASQGGGGGADALSGYLTHTEGAAQAKTNEPFQIAWPLAPGELGPGQTIRIYDDNGSGAKGTVLANFQVDGMSTDMVGDERICVISGFTPSLGSAATRKLHVDVSSTAAPTGTAITEANLFATAFRLVVSFNIAGSTTTIDTDNLEGASTSWNKANIVRHDDYMSGPGTVCFVYSAPVQAGGDGLRAYFHFYARKAGTAAVDGGNPITVVDWEVELCNMDAVRASPAHYYYGLQIQRSTSLSDGTLITTDQTDIDGNVTRMVYARSQPAVTLTATGFTSTGAKTWTRASGSWDSDILGAHITGDSGAAYVTARTNNTTIEVYVYDASASLTSLTSGNWTIEGVGHEYGRTWTIEGSVGTIATSKVLWGDNTSAVTPTTIAALTHLRSKKVVNNYNFAFSDVSHSMTALNLMRADSAIRPFTQLGPSGTQMGDLITDIGRGGDRADIGILFYPEALAKCDANGRRKMKEASLYLRSAPYYGTRRYGGSPSAGSLGVVMRPDCGTQYAYDTRWGTTIAVPSSGGWSPWDGNVAHVACTHFAPFLLTGRLTYLQRLQEQAFYDVTSSSDPSYQGSGINQTPFGDASLTVRGDTPWGLIEQRHLAWAFRGLCKAAFCTPDASKPSIFNAKSCMTTWVENTWDRGKFVMDTYTNGTGVEDYYDTDGPRPIGYRFNNNIDSSPWQGRYFDWSGNTVVELGMTTPDTAAFLAWMAVGYVGLSQSADVAPDFTTTAYEYIRCSVSGDLTKIDEQQSWADTYQAWMATPYDYETSPHRAFFPTSTYPRKPTTISLSATSGASVTVTMTGSPFGQTSWYAGNGSNIPGGWIYEVGGTGKGQIQSVSDANTCVISTTVTGGAAFSSTSPTASNVHLPIPHPLDAGADGSVTTGRDGVYMMLYKMAGEMYADRGIDTTAARSYITGLSNFPAIQNKMNIVARV